MFLQRGHEALGFFNLLVQWRQATRDGLFFWEYVCVWPLLTHATWRQEVLSVLPILCVWSLLCNLIVLSWLEMVSGLSELGAKCENSTELRESGKFALFFLLGPL